MKTNNGSYLNIDPDVFGYMWHGCKGDFSNLPEKIELYLEGYKGHGISDLLFNIFCQNSIVPTKHVGFIADKYNMKEEHGVAVDYSGETHTLAAYNAYRQMDDPIGYMFEKAKEQGYNAWLFYLLKPLIITNPAHSINWIYPKSMTCLCKIFFHYIFIRIIRRAKSRAINNCHSSPTQ